MVPMRLSGEQLAFLDEGLDLRGGHRPHQRRQLLHGEERALGVVGEGAVVLLLAHLREQRELAEACIEEYRIQLAEPGLRCAGERLDARDARGVRGEHVRASC